MSNPRLKNVFAKLGAQFGAVAFISVLLALSLLLANVVIGLFLLPVAVFASLAAIVMGGVGLSVLRSTGREGASHAVTGMAMGAFSLACAILCVLAIPTIQPAVDSMKSSNNLKQIAGAIHDFHSANKKLPSAIRDRDGNPLLSIRVTLLPYLGEQQLYDRFRFDEPWNSPSNLTLLDQMPAVYRSSRDKSKRSSMTFYRFVTGPGTSFERDGITFNDIKDGLSDTMIALEAGDAVPWTKPDEWEYDPNMPLPPVGGIFGPPKWYEIRRGQREETNVLMADGSVHRFERATPERFWRAIATRNGGEKVEWP